MSDKPPSTYTYHTDNSQPIQLDLFTPPDHSPETSAHKTIVFFHGGGLVSGSRRDRFPSFTFNLLLERGWILVTADYHLLPESSVENIRDDVVALEAWLCEHAGEVGIDLGRVVVSGSSAGAYVSVLACATWETIRPRAFFSLWGMLNTGDAWYHTKKLEGTPLGSMPVSKLEEQFYVQLLQPENPRIWDDPGSGTDISRRTAFFLWLLKEGKVGPLIDTSFRSAFQLQPQPNSKPHLHLLDLITPTFPPTIALHGAADSIVPISDSWALMEALKAVGVEGWLREVEGADHGCRPQENYAEDIEKCLGFLERWVG